MPNTDLEQQPIINCGPNDRHNILMRSCPLLQFLSWAFLHFVIRSCTWFVINLWGLYSYKGVNFRADRLAPAIVCLFVCLLVTMIDDTDSGHEESVNYLSMKDKEFQKHFRLLRKVFYAYEYSWTLAEYNWTLAEYSRMPFRVIDAQKNGKRAVLWTSTENICFIRFTNKPNTLINSTRTDHPQFVLNSRKV